MAETSKHSTLKTAKMLRRNMTDAEQRLWYFLRAKRFQTHKFRRQVPIGPYVVDFCAFEYRLIVEVDGRHHQWLRDARRTRYLKNQGFKVLRFWNNEVLNNISGVLYSIDKVIREEASKV